MSELSLSQIMNITTDSLHDAGINKSSVGDAIKSDYNNAMDRFGNWVAAPWKPASDNIVVPSGTETLIGKDFSELYVSCDVKEYAASDGSMLIALDPGSEYDTEMHGGYLSMGTLSSYADMDIKTKLVYETTLLAKKYAYQFDVDNPDANTALEDSFRDDITQYMLVSEANGFDWDVIVRESSNELQSETSDCLEASKKVIHGQYIQVDKNRTTAVRANRLMVSTAGPTYTDMIMPALSDKLTMSDMENYTSDIALSDDAGAFDRFKYAFGNFVKNVADKVKTWWEKHSLIHFTTTAVSEVGKGAVQTAKDIAAVQNVDDTQLVNESVENSADKSAVATEQSEDSNSGVFEDTAVPSTGADVWNQATNGVSYAVNKVQSTPMGETVKNNVQPYVDGAKSGLDQVETAGQTAKDFGSELIDGGKYGLEQTEAVRQNFKDFGNELINGGKYGIEQMKERAQTYKTKQQESQAQSVLGPVTENDENSCEDYFSQ